MASIRSCPLPDHALLAKYANGGAYTDCYVTEVPSFVLHPEYVEAFYTSAVFKLERRLLTWFVSKPSTDAQAKELAFGAITAFSAWRVEARTEDQLLMCDLSGRTRSWLMAVPVRGSGVAHSTRLYFGSAVVPIVDAASGRSRLGTSFKLLLGFHKLYSRVLLHTACTRLARRRGTQDAPGSAT
jgi:hypothetical protein